MATNEHHSTATNKPFVVGGVGHRALDSNTAPLERSIRRTFQQLIHEHQNDPKCIQLIVSVAEGADRLLIDAAGELAIPYICVLPGSSTHFARDFTSRESVEQFERQLALAQSVVAPSEDPADPVDGYRWVSRYLIEHCNLLLAIWDGEDGNGPAGTADTIQMALRNQLPVLWISATPPHDCIPHEPAAVSLN